MHKTVTSLATSLFRLPSTLGHKISKRNVTLEFYFWAARVSNKRVSQTLHSAITRRIIMVSREKLRADELLISKGLSSSKKGAQASILAGEVFCKSGRVDKPGQKLAKDADVWIKEKRKFVSRGGNKIEGAIEDFNLDVRDIKFLDLGASTGGFTDCLLQRGASKSYAVDVGRAQLAEKLRHDSRVWFKEGLNARYTFDIDEEVDMIVADVSFISLKLILPASISHLKNQGQILCLFKPQFEANKTLVGQQGVIRDPKVHARVLGDFCLWAIENELKIEGIRPSRLKGGKGNQEFFILFSRL